jgi:signal transduction histidine kinase
MAIIPVLELLFVYRYIGRDKNLSRYSGLLFIIPALTSIIALSNPPPGQAGWFIASWRLVRYNSISLEEIHFTGWFLVHASYSYLLGGLSVLLLVLHALKSKPGYRITPLILVLSVLVASVFLTLPVLLPLTAAGIPNITPVAFGANGVVMAWAIFHYDLFSLPTISFASILSYLQEAVIVTDAKNRVIELNPAAETIIRCPRGLALGKPIGAFFPECSEKLEKAETEPLKYEVRRGSYTYDLEVSTLAHLKRGPTPRYGYLLVLRDVTTQKREEQELKHAKEAAEAANRAKSRFLASMSHELRTPLNAILGFAELMAVEDEPTPEDYASYSEWSTIIHRNGEHLLSLINDLLEISKIEAGKSQLQPKVFKLQELITTIFQTFMLKAQSKNLNLELILSEELPCYVKADEAKLRQILLNLLGNALKFTDDGYIRLRVTPAGPKRLVFAVEDSGRGIAPEEQNLLFQPFSQTQSGIELQEGTGLGLVIVREYVGLMNGNISLTSEVNHGTTISFEIEIEPAENEA